MLHTTSPPLLFPPPIRSTSSHIGIVYPAAALGVIYDPRTGRQSYHEGHRGDIISLAVSLCGRFAASGDAACPPRVHVWDAVTGAGEMTESITPAVGGPSLFCPLPSSRGRALP